MLVPMNALAEDLFWFFHSTHAGAAGNQAPESPLISPITAEDHTGVISAVAWNKCFG